MAATTVTNWFGDLASRPARFVEAESLTDIASVLAKLSGHSTVAASSIAPATA